MKLEILIGLFFCHFLADYTHLSTTEMLSAKKLGKPLLPILIHAWVHTLLMGLFLLCMGCDMENLVVKLMLIQVTTHFAIDVWKGKMNSWFPALQSPANKWHWVIFGFDQFLHSFVIILMYSLTIK